MKKLNLFLALALLGSAHVAMADEKVITEDGIASFSTFKPGSVRAEVGTTGYGGAISWNANPYVGVTLGYNGGDISWSDDIKLNGSKYDLDMDNNNVYLNAEIRPFANWLYIAAGVAYLDNEYDVERRVSSGSGFRLNSQDYIATSDVRIKGKVDYKEQIAPYLGIGFSPAITNRFGLFGEVGAYYTGNPNANLSYTGTATTVSGAGLGNDVNAEERELENKSKFEWLPVAKVGLSVRF